MSHYTVLIFGDNPEEQLRPFDENLRETFKDCTEEVKKNWKEKKLPKWYADARVTVEKSDYDKLKQDGEIELEFPDEPLSGYKVQENCTVEINYEFPEEIWKDKDHPRWSEDIFVRAFGVKRKTEEIKSEENTLSKRTITATLRLIEPPEETSVKEKYSSFENFAKDYYGYEIDGEKIGYWKNENAKWDWYQLGGRWTGMLKLKKGSLGKIGKQGLQTSAPKPGYVDSALKKDIDFAEMKERATKEGSEAYDSFLAVYENDKGCKKFHPYFEYGVKGETKDGIFIPETKEQFMKRHSGFVTFAVLKDGVWYERGEMGWWAIVSDEKPEDQWDAEFHNLLDSISDDTLLSVYDCHI